MQARTTRSRLAVSARCYPGDSATVIPVTATNRPYRYKEFRSERVRKQRSTLAQSLRAGAATLGSWASSENKSHERGGHCQTLANARSLRSVARIDNVGAMCRAQRETCRRRLQSLAESRNLPFPMRRGNYNGAVAKWKGKGLQSSNRRFDSVPRLHPTYFRSTRDHTWLVTFLACSQTTI